MKTHKITFESRDTDKGVWFYVESLPSPFSWDKHLTGYISWYNYDASLPPYYNVMPFETRAFTLPYALYIAIYNYVQASDSEENFEFEFEGETYSIQANGAWPTCDEACNLETQFRKKHKLKDL